MSVRIRLRRIGRKKQPYYRVVVMPSSAPRDGAYIEEVGFYNPRTRPAFLTMDLGKVDSWLEKGAEVTESAASLIRKARKGGDAAVRFVPPGEEVPSLKTARKPERKPATRVAAPAEAAAPEVAPVEALAPESRPGESTGVPVEEGPSAPSDAEQVAVGSVPTAEPDAGEETVVEPTQEAAPAKTSPATPEADGEPVPDAEMEAAPESRAEAAPEATEAEAEVEEVTTDEEAEAPKSKSKAKSKAKSPDDEKA